MASGALVCGPFAAVKGTKGPNIVIPISTQGDWRGTDEGQELVRQASEQLAQAAETGTLPEQTIVDRMSLDNVVLRIPCENYLQATILAKQLKQSLPSMIGAAVLNPVRETDLG